MKRLLMVVLVVCLLSGCAGVIMNPEYSQLLDKTTALSAETATRAHAGELTEAQKTEALIKQAEVWRQFKNAKDGVK
ncbi:MAG TPA: hypothetical protein VNA25_09305 [Phycisphaerae bacterium]|nr:hypothetical protein [Phycisphaerae bacterium]